MCKAGTKIMEIIGNEPNKKGQQKAIKQIKNIYKEEKSKKGNKQIEIAFEKVVGILFMSINVMIGDLMKKMENGDELKQLLVQDPCEEAKLKLKKMEMADESNSEVIKKDKGNAKSKGKKR
ncbi:hypothetical protein niasHT_010532 [Heterodera trifolii]|uniref:Uncharacterized protein n=1 Tax=Heterodera trifolii TaxID=157864 RepID=A0ABD2L214_9BILA